ncbi:hypothetical protein M0R45_026510 [Rubus argutus]|uniref:Ubiquitin-like protease family profile domain-containing protein n=1 Tax=Rubus argutus TaxID=59490 RepID=A0AAW1WXQ5_RUBAR
MFKDTISIFSKEKKEVMGELGFSILAQLGCSNLNRELCQMLVENFDPINMCVQIHGKTISIGPQDFERIMGIRDGGGGTVDITGSIDEEDIKKMMKIYAQGGNEIKIINLQKYVKESEKIDDTFKIGVSLFVVATLLCPTVLDTVQPKFLLPLRDAMAIRTKNWATFCFFHLVEGVKSFKLRGSGFMDGCLLFLQLFYFDVISHRDTIVNKCLSPVVAWGDEEIRKLFKYVNEIGGVHSTTVLVVKPHVDTKHVHPKSSKVYEDEAVTKADVIDLKADMLSLTMRIDQMEPQMNKMTTMQEQQSKRNDPPMIHNISSEYVRDHNSVQGVHKKCKNTDKNNVHSICSSSPNAPQLFDCKSGSQRPLNFDYDGRFSGLVYKRNIRSKVGPFAVHVKLTEEDYDIVRFLFPAYDIHEPEASQLVASTGSHVLTRREVKNCLAPTKYISNDVINYMADVFNETGSGRWYLPTYMADKAKIFMTRVADCPEIDWYSEVAPLCRLNRFEGQLSKCQQLKFLDSVFGIEISKLEGDLFFQFQDFELIVPNNNPLQSNPYDCGVYVIRNMQYYGTSWHENFNSSDQRVRLLFEIIRHPKNVIIGYFKELMNIHKGPARVNPKRNIIEVSDNTCSVNSRHMYPRKAKLVSLSHTTAVMRRKPRPRRPR